MKRDHSRHCDWLRRGHPPCPGLLKRLVFRNPVFPDFVVPLPPLTKGGVGGVPRGPVTRLSLSFFDVRGFDGRHRGPQTLSPSHEGERVGGRRGRRSIDGNKNAAFEPDPPGGYAMPAFRTPPLRPPSQGGEKAQRRPRDSAGWERPAFSRHPFPPSARGGKAAPAERLVAAGGTTPDSPFARGGKMSAAIH